MIRVHVVAAVIYNPSGTQILIAKRPDHLHQGGLWEFPGGKVDKGETPQQALLRELNEELAIKLTQCQPLIEVRHDYPDKSVFLDVWQVTAFTGEPKGAEGQEIAWVKKSDLAGYAFPKANEAIIEKILSVVEKGLAES